MSMRWRRLGPAVSVALLLVLGAGCADQNNEASSGDAGDVSVAVDDESPAAPEKSDAEPSTMAEGFGVAPSPSGSPSTKSKPTTKPKRKQPSKETKLPPPAPAPAPDSCDPTYRGKALSRSAAKAALVAAAKRQYWPSSAPEIMVPVDLVKAVAWQESGWQSNIIACDGGVGLMQVMTGTADFVNVRFEKSYDINTPTDNAILGVNYLAWLIKYFGDEYFDGVYTLGTTDECESSSVPCLMDAVIAAYNVGPGNVETPDRKLVIPNKRYVDNVRALMTDNRL